MFRSLQKKQKQKHWLANPSTEGLMDRTHHQKRPRFAFWAFSGVPWHGTNNLKDVWLLTSHQLYNKYIHHSAAAMISCTCGITNLFTYRPNTAPTVHVRIAPRALIFCTTDAGHMHGIRETPSFSPWAKTFHPVHVSQGRPDPLPCQPMQHRNTQQSKLIFPSLVLRFEAGRSGGTQHYCQF